MSKSLCKNCDGSGWCGACYEIKKGRVAMEAARRSHVESVLSQTGGLPPAHPDQKPAQPAPGASPTVPEDWRSRYPHLFSHLTQGRWDDASVRITSTLLIFLEDGRLKLALHDRDMGRIAFLTASGMPAGLAELEDALARGTLEWRRKKPFGPVKGRTS